MRGVWGFRGGCEVRRELKTKTKEEKKEKMGKYGEGFTLLAAQTKKEKCKKKTPWMDPMTNKQIKKEEKKKKQTTTKKKIHLFHYVLLFDVCAREAHASFCVLIFILLYPLSPPSPFYIVTQCRPSKPLPFPHMRTLCLLGKSGTFVFFVSSLNFEGE